MKPLLAIVSGISAALLALAPEGAGAAEKPAPPATRPGGKVLRIEALTVEGQLQKPEAFYILQRANLEFDELERAENFLPKIVKSQENALF